MDTHRLARTSFRAVSMKSVEELDRELSALMRQEDICSIFPESCATAPPQLLSICLHYMRQALSVITGDAPDTLALKMAFSTGKEQGSVPPDMEEAVGTVASRARALMEGAGQDTETPQHVALSAGLYCYGAVLCTDSLSAENYGDLFFRCWSILQIG